MGVDQAWEKFSIAIRLALVSDAPPQDRLDRLVSSVSHLQRESFPDEHVWDEFRRLMNEIAKRGTHQQVDGRVHGSTAPMSGTKANECLLMAFDIFCQLAKAFGRTEFVI